MLAAGSFAARVARAPTLIRPHCHRPRCRRRPRSAADCGHRPILTRSDRMHSRVGGVLACESLAHHHHQLSVARALAHSVAQRDLLRPKQTDLPQSHARARAPGATGRGQRCWHMHSPSVLPPTVAAVGGRFQCQPLASNAAATVVARQRRWW